MTKNKITIRFDGGCRPTNPGNKYGSFEVSLNGRSVVLVSRIELGWGTNNEAEFEIFVKALLWTDTELKRAGNTPDQFHLEAFSDSITVINRLKGIAKANKKDAGRRMQSRSDKCLSFARKYLSFEVYWNNRRHNVNKFGH